MSGWMGHAGWLKSLSFGAHPGAGQASACPSAGQSKAISGRTRENTSLPPVLKFREGQKLVNVFNVNYLNTKRNDKRHI